MIRRTDLTDPTATDVRAGQEGETFEPEMTQSSDATEVHTPEGTEPHEPWLTWTRFEPGARQRAASPTTAERQTVGSAASLRGPQLANSRSLEDFLGGRVLAWAGALTVLTGIVLFVAVAIGRGWIDEHTRIALAFVGSGLMLTAGAWLYEKRGTTQAARATTGTGLAGLYLSLTAGAQLYHLYDPTIALAEAGAIGLVGTALAIRWNSRTVATLAIGGALLAPPLVDAQSSDLVTGFLLIALASAVGVLIAKRWNWLAVGCFVVAAPQLVAWVFITDPGPLAVIAVMSAYALVNAAAALGHELRTKSGKLQPSSTFLVLAGALVAAGGGHAGLARYGLGDWWIAALAVAHLTTAALALRRSQHVREIALVTAGAGTVLADIAFGTLASGPMVTAGWAASAALLGLIVKQRPREVHVARIALGGQLVLAIGHVLLFDASPDTLLAGTQNIPAALVGVGSVGLTAFICARLDGTDARIAGAFDAVAAVALLYGTAYTLDGAPLAIAWAGIAAALAVTIGRDLLGFWVSAGFLAMAGLHVIVFDAPMDALAYGVHDLPGTAAALAAVAAGGLAISRQLRSEDHRSIRTAFEACAAAALLYLASVAIIDVFQPSSTESFDPGFALGVRQQGQVLLSGLWAAAGALALVSGLKTDRIELRVAGFGLLAVAFGKVLVFDLSTLDSIYRVASCVGLGLLLLMSAFAYQRARPRLR